MYGSNCSIVCSGNEGNKVNNLGGGRLINYGTITAHWYTDKQNGADTIRGLEGAFHEALLSERSKTGGWGGERGPSERGTRKASALGLPVGWSALLFSDHFRAEMLTVRGVDGDCDGQKVSRPKSLKA